MDTRTGSMNAQSVYGNYISTPEVVTWEAQSRSKENIYKGLDVILQDYNQVDYYITRIRGDHKFRPLLEDIEDKLDIELDIVAQGEHVPKA